MGETKRPKKVEVEPELTLEKIETILRSGNCTQAEVAKFTAKALEIIRKGFKKA